MRFQRGLAVVRRDGDPKQHLAPIPDFATPPAGLLFRHAHPATLPSGFVGIGLTGRDSVGPTCAANETKCSEGDWCCDTGETCSLDNGIFLCCALGPDGASCSRVCAAGDFQCGSICCANGQTCSGVEFGAPFCVNSSSSSSSSATPSPTTSTTRLSTSSSSPTTSSKSTNRSLVTTSRSFSTLELAPTNMGTFTPLFPTQTSTSVTQTPSSENAAGGGLPMGVGIAIGVIVPVVVVILIASLWFFLCCRPRKRSPSPDDDGAGRPPVPPPKNEITVTTNHRYTFSRARSPTGSVRTQSTMEMAMLPKEKSHISAALGQSAAARTAKMRGEQKGGTPTGIHPGVGLAR